MKCPQCGTEHPPETYFCFQCGYEFVPGSRAAFAHQQAPPPKQSVGGILLKTCLGMIAVGVLLLIAGYILLWSICGRMVSGS